MSQAINSDCDKSNGKGEQFNISCDSKQCLNVTRMWSLVSVSHSPENLTRCMRTNSVNELGTGTALERETDVFD